jgi:hypothetical protein
MTVHRNRLIVNKTNRCTEFQFYWYYYSTCFGQPFCPSSGVLSRKSTLVHFMQLWPFATRNRMERSSIPLLVATGSSQQHKMYQSRCTDKNSWWWAERLPETCRVVISIKLEFSASVGFIHKKFDVIHGDSFRAYFRSLQSCLHLVLGNQQIACENNTYWFICFLPRFVGSVQTCIK